MPKEVVLKFPFEFPEKCLKNKKALAKGKEAFVMELLRKHEISQGKAAELLRVNRWDFIDLMAQYKIPAIDMTAKELKRELGKDISQFFDPSPLTKKEKESVKKAKAEYAKRETIKWGKSK